MGKDLSQRVALQTVRDRVRSQLHVAVDDPDFQRFFDFLISNGVGSNAYIDNLLQRVGCFVDSTRRQLRFSAFAVVSTMCEQAPHANGAVLKKVLPCAAKQRLLPEPRASMGRLLVVSSAHFGGIAAALQWIVQ